MDGAVAPLRALARAAQDTGAVLVVDEAHALGVLGPGGRGLCAAAGIIPNVLIGTVGKAFGSFGRFVAGQSP
jgi:8-amino-7-oxononanoate synthase